MSCFDRLNKCLKKRKLPTSRASITTITAFHLQRGGETSLGGARRRAVEKKTHQLKLWEKSKHEIVKINRGFPSKLTPQTSFADPRSAKKGPHGPDRLSRWPPGRPQGRQMHLSGPPLGTPGGPTGPNFKKNDIFWKIAETTIIIRSGALREKQATLQNRGFRVLDPPWSAPEAEPVPPGPPPSSPKVTLEVSGSHKILPGAPKSPP